MGKIHYPLKEVLDVKKRRVEDAEAVVKEKISALEKENEKLAQREKERNQVKQHHTDKMRQLRQILDEGTTSPKIQQMKAYLKVVIEKLKVEEKKVADQKIQVETAQKNLDAAKLILKQKRLEVDKMLTHKKDWEKEIQKEAELHEVKEQDELGSINYAVNQHKRGN